MPAPVSDYASQLLTIKEAEAKFRLSPNTFKRFRRRHTIETLTGGYVHEADIIRAYDRERGISNPQPKSNHV